MKKTFYTIATLFVVLTSMSSFAANRSNPLSVNSSKTVINAYMAASVLGDGQLSKDLLTNDFTFTSAANGTTHAKKAYSKFLKGTKGLKYNCTTRYEMLSENDNTALAKATMQFEGFTRVDMITLQASTEGWKIAKIVSDYQ